MLKKNSAIETLLVECVEGKPYSKWNEPMAGARDEEGVWER